MNLHQFSKTYSHFVPNGLSPVMDKDDKGEEQHVQLIRKFADPKKEGSEPVLVPGYFRSWTDAAFRKLWEAGDRAKLISETYADESGTAIWSLKEASNLPPLYAAELERYALKVNGFGSDGKAQEEAGNG